MTKSRIDSRPICSTMQFKYLFYRVDDMSGSLGSRLELTTLKVVVDLDGRAYGAQVRRVVSDLCGHDYSVGAIYTTLARLQDKGFLTSRMTQPLARRGGRSRRIFEVTATGVAALRHAADLASQLWQFDAALVNV